LAAASCKSHSSLASRSFQTLRPCFFFFVVCKLRLSTLYRRTRRMHSLALRSLFLIMAATLATAAAVGSYAIASFGASKVRARRGARTVQHTVNTVRSFTSKSLCTTRNVATRGSTQQSVKHCTSPESSQIQLLLAIVLQASKKNLRGVIKGGSRGTLQACYRWKL
jgi:hypothetical protein